VGDGPGAATTEFLEALQGRWPSVTI
jgi:hypothetical protein